VILRSVRDIKKDE
jgi:hypothetical protein